MMKRLLVLAAAAALVIPACSSDDGGIDITLSDFKVEPSETSAAAGELTFNVTNDAEQTHEFVVVKTDLAPDKLPTVADGDEAGTVDEEGAGIEAMGEKEDILAGTDNNVLTLTLAAGHYVIFCNVHDEDLVHYQKGMHTDFTVQ